MPELPEVETIKTSLLVNLGSRVNRIDINREDIIRQWDFKPEDIYNHAITHINRRGKYLAITFDNSLNLVVHMGMSGRFYMMNERAQIEVPHVHFIIHLDNERKIVYQDARRFGGVWFCSDTAKLFAHMGVEPLSREFTAAYLLNICNNRKVAVKTLLLNQGLISGIGNIYADEALFAACIRPERPAGTLSAQEAGKLHQAIRKVLKHSIKERGTTFRDFRDGYNREGGFQNSLKVYGKTDQACPSCSAPIKINRIGGRSSHYCEHCQK